MSQPCPGVGPLPTPWEGSETQAGLQVLPVALRESLRGDWRTLCVLVWPRGGELVVGREHP